MYIEEECQYRGSHIPSDRPAVSIRVINFVWELGKWRINELAGGIMCAGTEKGVRERNLWASGKSQLSARRTPRAHILGTPATAHTASPRPDDIMFRLRTVGARLYLPEKKKEEGRGKGGRRRRRRRVVQEWVKDRDGRRAR